MHRAQLQVQFCNNNSNDSYNLSFIFRDSWNRQNNITARLAVNSWQCTLQWNTCSIHLRTGNLWSTPITVRLLLRCALSRTNILLATWILFRRLQTISDISLVDRMLQQTPCLAFPLILCSHLRILTYGKWPLIYRHLNLKLASSHTSQCPLRTRRSSVTPQQTHLDLLFWWLIVGLFLTPYTNWHTPDPKPQWSWFQLDFSGQIWGVISLPEHVLAYPAKNQRCTNISVHPSEHSAPQTLGSAMSILIWLDHGRSVRDLPTSWPV